MENGPFEEVFPIEDVFHCYVGLLESNQISTFLPFKRYQLFWKISKVAGGIV